jgi:hypothetical protein
VVFLLLPGSDSRLVDESRPLMASCLLSVVLAAAASASFYTELKQRPWRYLAHAGLFAMLAIAVWTYWPRN